MAKDITIEQFATKLMVIYHRDVKAGKDPMDDLTKLFNSNVWCLHCKSSAKPKSYKSGALGMIVHCSKCDGVWAEMQPESDDFQRFS